MKRYGSRRGEGCTCTERFTCGVCCRQAPPYTYTLTDTAKENTMRTTFDLPSKDEENFFGPQKYVSEIITQPPYTARVNMTRYGYESEHAIYDVVIPERPIRGLSRWYKTNGVSSLFPTATHRRIEIHFNIGIPTYTGQ